MKRLTSCLLAFALMLSMLPNAFAVGDSAENAQAPTQIDDSTVWRYLDDNTDPAGDPAAADYDRTSWTSADFNDSAWKTASGTFGGKKDGDTITSDGAASAARTGTVTTTPPTTSARR